MFYRFGHWLLNALLLVIVNVLLMIHHYPITLIVLVDLIFIACGVLLAYHFGSTRQHTINLIDTLLISLRQGDYALRAVHAKDRQLHSTVEHVNALAQTMQADQRALAEHSDLLKQIIEKIDCALIVFDSQKVAFANSYAERTFLDCYKDDVSGWFQSLQAERKQGKVSVMLSGVEHAFLLEHDSCYIANKPHTLLVLKQLDSILYQQEKDALQRFVRILSHEINNTLAPIGTVARSLTKRLNGDIDIDRFSSGLALINERASYLKSFMGNYASLAKLPPAHKQIVALNEFCAQLQSIYPQLKIESTADLLGFFDTSQIKQVLCHLINNAHEACTPSPEVTLNITVGADKLVFSVTDTGPGFSNLNEAAEAFYTTKADGSGIGLMLSRIIIENHSGQLKLGNNPSGGAKVSFCVERGGD
ncbi:HAMP domain-containing histidine kinase [Pseudoalteromonas sp. SCSIO 43201]|uniref:sensor histidine kinase n=1 Tax=Pseudoalteromonas sp. SCSIO 43201 TaxID=2822842 RepID=UPI00207534C1|nr:HAMP domain-containing sensor histidine kinase [Pseudoalteromonas sp. SCSIO 43201]USD30388.1 HAMP domain-containing histidine kinase [Pseudoalteromonas sp. SCSIO 43201]